MSERKVDLTVQQWEMQLDAAFQGGQSLEREAILAFLHDDKEPIRRKDADGDTLYRQWEGSDFADAIERGEHVKNTDRSLHDNETCKEGCDDE